jgi:hypothetical protein
VQADIFEKLIKCQYRHELRPTNRVDQSLVTPKGLPTVIQEASMQNSTKKASLFAVVVAAVVAGVILYFR